MVVALNQTLEFSNRPGGPPAWMDDLRPARDVGLWRALGPCNSVQANNPPPPPSTETPLPGGTGPKLRALEAAPEADGGIGCESGRRYRGSRVPNFYP